MLVEWHYNRYSVTEVWDHEGELYLMNFLTNADGTPFRDDIIPGSVFDNFTYDYSENPGRYCIMKYKVIINNPQLLHAIVSAIILPNISTLSTTMVLTRAVRTTPTTFFSLLIFLLLGVDAC